MNIDGFERKKKSFIFKAFNLSTVELLYLAIKVLPGPQVEGVRQGPRQMPPLRRQAQGCCL